MVERYRSTEEGDEVPRSTFVAFLVEAAKGASDLFERYEGLPDAVAAVMQAAIDEGTVTQEQAARDWQLLAELGEIFNPKEDRI